MSRAAWSFIIASICSFSMFQFQTGKQLLARNHTKRGSILLWPIATLCGCHFSILQMSDSSISTGADVTAEEHQELIKVRRVFYGEPITCKYSVATHSPWKLKQFYVALEVKALARPANSIQQFAPEHLWYLRQPTQRNH